MSTRETNHIKESERAIYNKGYGREDILPNRELITLLFSQRDNWIKNRLNKLKNSNTSLLDVGCGFGGTSQRLAKQGFSVTGIDISDNQVITANKSAKELGFDIKYIIGDVENSCFIDNSFDVISCSSILHHLPDLDNDLTQFKAILKNGGSIIVTEPCLLNPFAFIRRKFFPTSVHTPDEHPFIPGPFIKKFKQRFSHVEYKYFYILSLAAPILEKIFGKKTGLFFLKLLAPIDRVLTRIPVIREFSWIVNIHAYK